MIPSMIPRAAPSAQNPAPAAKITGRSPLAQLLHALNQPLTGLQCSMEVALASPRTREQYVRGLREGLELTERMRALVEAIREVTDLGEDGDSHRHRDGGRNRNRNNDNNDNNDEEETVELNHVLRQALEDLAPVAEAKSVRITLDCPPASCLVVKARQRTLFAVLFRFLEAALSLAARGSVLVVDTGRDTGRDTGCDTGCNTGREAGGATAEARLRVCWHAGRPVSLFSRAELGLLVAQAGLERAGATWERERTENLETATVRWPSPADGPGHS